jgi:hypothetical protein
MRTVNLTDEERRIFFEAEVKEKDVQKLMKEYTIMNTNNARYVLCERKRDDGNDANFMDTGLALTGILENGESLQDFIEFRLRMRHVIKHRNRDTVIESIQRSIKKGEI